MLHYFLIIFRRSYLVIVAGICMAATAMQAESNLVQNSPFLPEGWGEEKEPPPKPIEVPPQPPVSQLAREIEFRGVFQIGNGKPKFNLFDKKNQKGFWLALDEANDRFKVTRYNKASGSITLTSAGRSEEISMAKPDGAPLPIQSTPNALTTGQPPQINTSRPASDIRKSRVLPRRRIIRRSSSSARPQTTNTIRTPPPAQNVTPPPAPAP